MNTHQIKTKVHDGKIIVDAPADLKENQEVNLIIEYVESQKKFDFSTLRGSSNMNLSADEIDEEINKLRKEWDRDIL
ncbi:MAG: hypothetical protein ABI723_03670 [Bacteroidia bacterium]